jgi:hypothetical protein
MKARLNKGWLPPLESEAETSYTYFGPLVEWRAESNVFIPPTLLMLHVWLFRPSPEACFTHNHDIIEVLPVFR